jgi:GTP 3',8-cyclase
MARQFRKLRVSLTRACNFGCTYCAADGKPVADNQHTSVATFCDWIQRLLAHVPIANIRLTGGEPTLYPELVELVASLVVITDAEISMTTNGYAMASLALSLREAGLTSVNISLDAANPEIFAAMGGRSYAAVIAGIEASGAVGLRVKLNATIMRGINDCEILPLLEFSRARNIPLRYLELMQMGHLWRRGGTDIVTADEILNTIRQQHPFESRGRNPSATAEQYQLEDGYRFGIIGNTSMPFCHDCDRLRLDSGGKLFGCLSDATGYFLDDAPDVSALLDKAMLQKQTERFLGSELVMREVGG